MTDHPLSETAAAKMWDNVPESVYAHSFADEDRDIQDHTTAAMRAAYDAGREHERNEDDRPWVPLGEDDPLNAGDEVLLDHLGVTTTAVVARVDEEGDPWTDEYALIGIRRSGTWHVRRAAPTLPTEDGAVIVPAEGQDWIVVDIDGTTHNTKRLTLTKSDGGFWYWIGLSNTTDNPFAAYTDDIVPGTWLDTNSDLD